MFGGNLYTVTAILAGMVPLSLCCAQARSLSTLLTLTSDYRLRGVSQNNQQVTPQIEIDFDAGDGWSFGTIGSKVDFKDQEDTSVEVDLFANKHFDLAEIGVDIGGFYYSYPDHDLSPGSTRYSMEEVTGALARTWGALTLSAAGAWSPDYFGQAGNGWYLEGGAQYEIEPWLSLSSHLGQQWVQHWDSRIGSGHPYQHWDVGLTATFDQASIDLRYVGTSLTKAECLLTQGGLHWCETTVIASLSYRVGVLGDE